MLLDKVKITLKMDDNILDNDIQDTIDAAIADMKLCGVLESKIDEADPIIIRAIKTFCRAEYSTDDKESYRYKESYEMIRNHLSMSVDYNTEVVTP
jgi:hypothetical protein